MNGAAAAPAPCPFCQQAHPEDVFVCPTAGKVLPLEGRLLDGKFRFTKLLGAGGMGAVWRAQNIRVRKAVAIKLMHAEFAGNPGILDRFRNEATAAGQIGNPHICDIYDFGQSVLGPYIVLEMLNGRSLGELVQQTGQVDPGLAVLIIRQALIGLDAAHAVGIVHRDLKPENIFLHEPSPGHLLVKLMDFGISKFSQGGTEGGGRTSAGVLMGTPEYMSPEQTEGAAGVDLRTDIWAMGAILYKALTGADAFMGATMAAILVAVSTKQPTPIAQLAPHVPPGLIAVIERCLAKEPGDRFASCSELSAALAPFEQLGAPLPAMASHTHAPPMTSAPMTGGPSSLPPPQATGPVATVITGGPPPTSHPGVAPVATVITGGPPPSTPPTNKPTWSGELGKPHPAEESWSLGRAEGHSTQLPMPTSSGGGKGIFLVIALLVLVGGGVGAYFMMKPKTTVTPPPPPEAIGAATAAPETKTTPPPETKVETPPTPDTKVETPPDTKVETPPDTKVETPPDTKVETPPDTKEDTKKDDTKKPQPKPKELISDTDVAGLRLPGKMLWEKAKEHCESSTADGLKTWRLPKSGEVLKFRKSPKLANRKVWTSEMSAGRVKVVDINSGAVEEVAPNTPKIDVTCVALK
ncbi:protein kinase domain-containing protein [Nannocystis radixulma]|uniref:Protein kinase n=1 Tax=Nannocystis radixulma TaxID=2995305 RepID=A0ABT5BB71_9BACT|nr:protein kinase [Nannocystis radixulma]MDC0670282.1 protein kinase [Nannocystis radixulma]